MDMNLVSDELKLELGDPETFGHIASAVLRDYVAEAPLERGRLSIERLAAGCIADLLSAPPYPRPDEQPSCGFSGLLMLGYGLRLAHASRIGPTP
jgi:hypothetical protein